MEDPFTLNVEGVANLIGSDVNKVKEDKNDLGTEGADENLQDELSLKLSDRELLRIRNDIEARYAPYEKKQKKIWEQNLESYLGKKKDAPVQWGQNPAPTASNLQFEAMETFLAASLAKNPEPVVWADNTPEGNQVASDVKTMLSFHADQLVIRRKLQGMVRQWAIYHLGVLKMGWHAIHEEDTGNDYGDVEVSLRKIQNFIFDPEGYVDCYGDFVGALGERIEVSAKQLAAMFPKHKEYISMTVDGKMGTKVTYTEWWSADETFTFLTYKDIVLDKHKNEFFNYPRPQIDPVTGAPMIDPQTGQLAMERPHNHFSRPKKPYVFLSVFSLQEQPHDITGLVEQNIANQNRITERASQIDFNIGASNNGYAFRLGTFNEEQARQAAMARRNGDPILIPESSEHEPDPIVPLEAMAMPASAFNELEVIKNDLRSSWGIQGIVSQPNEEDITARGMILNQAHDTSRIGGGIGDALEQVADALFNWLTQMYTVFYDEAHFASIMGNAKAVEFITLTGEDLSRQLIVSVAPDSLKPKDEVTQMNLAQQLFEVGAIGPKTLLKMLDFPNPDEAAGEGVLYKMDPQTYLRVNFPELFAQIMQAQQPQMQPGQAQGQPIQGGAPPTMSAPPASSALSNVQLPQ